MIKNITGRVWKFGDDINTDLLAPGVYMKCSLEELSSHCLETVNSSFAGEFKKSDLILFLNT